MEIEKSDVELFNEQARRVRVSALQVAERARCEAKLLLSKIDELAVLAGAAGRSLDFKELPREALEAELMRCNAILVQDGKTIAELRQQLQQVEIKVREDRSLDRLNYLQALERMQAVVTALNLPKSDLSNPFEIVDRAIRHLHAQNGKRKNDGD